MGEMNERIYTARNRRALAMPARNQRTRCPTGHIVEQQPRAIRGKRGFGGEAFGIFKHTEKILPPLKQSSPVNPVLINFRLTDIPSQLRLLPPPCYRLKPSRGPAGAWVASNRYDGPIRFQSQNLGFPGSNLISPDSLLTSYSRTRLSAAAARPTRPHPATPRGATPPPQTARACRARPAPARGASR